MQVKEIIKLIESLSKEYNIDVNRFTIEDCKSILNSSKKLKDYIEKNFDSEKDYKYLNDIDNLFLSTIIQLYLDEKNINMSINSEENENEVINTNSENLSEKLYFKEVLKYTVPTKEEEQELFKRYKNGDMKARDEIVSRNQRYIIKIAKKYSSDNEMLLSLIQEGNIGLIKAIDKFDYSMGFKFLTYASYSIKREIINHLRRMYCPLEIPQRLYFKNIEFKRILEECYNNNMPIPSNQELSEVLGISLDDIEILKYIKQLHILNLNESVNDDSETETGEFVPDENAISPEEEAINKICCSDILNYLETILTKEELEVVKLTYGFNDENRCEDVKTIGEKLNLKPFRVSQLQKNTLSKIRCKGYNFLKEFRY